MSVYEVRALVQEIGEDGAFQATTCRSEADREGYWGIYRRAPLASLVADRGTLTDALAFLADLPDTPAVIQIVAEPEPEPKKEAR